VKQNDSNYNKYKINYIKKIKKVVYSVIIGKYDKILPFTKQEGYSYFLFADQIYHNSNWTIIPIKKLLKKTNISKLKMTRYFKLFPHLFFKDYDLSIYIDATFIVKGNLNEILLRTLNPSFDIYFLQHPFRNKILQECSKVLLNKRETKKIINIVKKRYIKENYPDNIGLTENCIIIRRHNNKKVIKLMDIWWNEIKNYSYRDQLSLNYAIWKLNSNLKIYYLSKAFVLDYFSYKKHKKPTKFF
jgi:16S rRNA G966 N2-methylase RsmD